MTGNATGWLTFILRPVGIFPGGFQISGAGDILIVDIKIFPDQGAIAKPIPAASVKFAVEGTDLHFDLAVVVPVTLEAGAVDHGERTEQTTGFIPFAAHAVHQAIPITQLLGKLAVAMPDAASAMKNARHFPVFRVGLTVTVIKPFYVKLWLHSENHKIE